jgi:hypothetical protein
VHSHVALGKSWIDETIEYDTAHLGEYVKQGSPEREVIRQKRLRYSRTVHVETDDGIVGTMRMTGQVVVPPFEHDAAPAAMLDVAGRGHVDYVIRGSVKRGAMPWPVGFDVAGIFPGEYRPMRAMADEGPECVHFGLAPAEQVDAVIDEIRRHLPKEAKRPDTISDADYKRLTDAEHDDLARDALHDAIKLPSILKKLLIALGVIAALLALVLAAIFAPVELAVAAIALLVAAAVAALIYAFRDTIKDAIRRFADSDVFGAILTILKGVAIVAGIILGVIAIAAAIIGAPLELGAALIVAAIAIVIGLVLAYHDYDRAKRAPDLAHFHQDIQTAADGFEGAIVDAVVTLLTLLIPGGRPGQKALPPGQSPPKPKLLPPGTPPEPEVIHPPSVAPAAPPNPDIPQVGPPGPTLPETPQVAGPTVMVPHVPLTPAVEATGGALRTKSMVPFFRGEHVPGNTIWGGGSAVRYLTPGERASYRLTFRGGKIYDANGALFDTSTASPGHSGKPSAIFVVDEDGYFYASNYHEEGKFHHSSFFAGDPVAAAGELTVENGVLKGFTDQSGHYLPTYEYTQQAVDILASQGIDMSGVATTRRPAPPPRRPRPRRP